jgi:polyhydroxybutyrate depolymerase
MKLACGALLGFTLAFPAFGQTVESRHIDIDGVDRSYSFYIPGKLASGSPLLIVLHGSASSGRYDIEHNHWREKADKEGFAVVAPDALANYDGVEPRRTTGPRDWARAVKRWWQGNDVARWQGGLNDTSLVLKSVEQIAALTPFDRARVYVVGFSRGGFFAHGLALTQSDRIAAVAVLSPNLEPELKAKPARPVPFLLVGGDRDNVMPVGGPRPAEILERWRTIDQCPRMVSGEPLQSGLALLVAGPCAEGSEVRYVVASGIGHDWPLTPINYTDLTWDFLRRFARPTQP